MKQSFEEKYDITINTLIELASNKRIVDITDFCNSLKEKNLNFSIYGNPIEENSIYFYLGEISADCIEEKLPNITTLIDFKDELKPFYRLIDTGKLNDEEEKEFLKKYPKDEARRILSEERQKVFEFNWNNLLNQNNKNEFEFIEEIIKQESNQEKREIVIEARINFPNDLRQQIFKRANFKCENKNCKNPNSFTDKNGDIFLEIHHKVPYSKCKKHSLENCIALCPNCHKQIHFGNVNDVDL